MIKKVFNKAYLQYLLIGIALSLMPLLQRMGIVSSAAITIFGTILFYAIVASGLNILLGYSGLISLGTAGFMGFGAYLSAYLTQEMNLPFVLSLILAVLVPLAVGLLVGLVSLRLEGMYLAIATLVVSEILKKIFIEFDAITGGFSGMSASYPVLFGQSLTRDTTYLFIVAVLVAVMILTHHLARSATGRALLTMRGSEAAAQAMGIHLLKYKLMAFAIATGLAGLGGALYVHFIRFSYPSTWSLTLSLQILAVIVIGGMRSITGPLIGSIVVFGIPELVLKKLPVIGSIDGLSFIFTGILIILVILFYPKGLAYLGEDLKQLGRKKKRVGESNAEA